jgi:hypothetical protein
MVCVVFWIGTALSSASHNHAIGCRCHCHCHCRCHVECRREFPFPTPASAAPSGVKLQPSGFPDLSYTENNILNKPPEPVQSISTPSRVTAASESPLPAPEARPSDTSPALHLRTTGSNLQKAPLRYSDRVSGSWILPVGHETKERCFF